LRLKRNEDENNVQSTNNHINEESNAPQVDKQCLGKTQASLCQEVSS
jgi:hypothetical protein